MPELRLFEDPEFVPESQRLYMGSLSRQEALDLWRYESCSEFTNKRHAFMLTIEQGSVQLACDVCRYNPVEDGDLSECVYFGPIPVDVQITNIVHPGGPWGATEYDVEVEVTPR